jgi:hypothetical protein
LVLSADAVTKYLPSALKLAELTRSLR